MLHLGSFERLREEALVLDHESNAEIPSSQNCTLGLWLTTFRRLLTVAPSARTLTEPVTINGGHSSKTRRRLAFRECGTHTE